MPSNKSLKLYGFIHALSSSLILRQFLKMERAYEHHHTRDLQKLQETVSGKAKFTAGTMEDLRTLLPGTSGWSEHPQKTRDFSDSVWTPDTTSSTEKSSIALTSRWCGDCIQRDPCQTIALAGPLGTHFLPPYICEPQGASA